MTFRSVTQWTLLLTLVFVTGGMVPQIPGAGSIPSMPKLP